MAKVYSNSDSLKTSSLYLQSKSELKALSDLSR